MIKNEEEVIQELCRIILGFAIVLYQNTDIRNGTLLFV